ncbi:cytochrome P450 6k1-like [Cryptotermes secundus]|uniref:cytochrome P450 6k1-like n=1 Tax=Cryptotermes secundus TaxID=105785 RepID=UPI001454C893|nr:cytochrome P450 6k1-like [Cryptotermes secundus]
MNTAVVNIIISLCKTFLVILLVLYAYYKYRYSYWKKKGVAYLEPSFPFGNIGDALLQRKSVGLQFQDIYNKLAGHELGGAFSFIRPMLIVREPEMIKNIVVKDFVHFHGHGTYFDEESEPLSANLFTLSGYRWRNLRTNLTPTFTSGKMKTMFQILVDCGNELGKHVDQSAANGDNIEVKDILAKFSTDVIALFAFGVQCNCLKNPDAEFRKWGRKIFETNRKTGVKDVAMFVAPALPPILKIPFVPLDVSQYFKKMVKETVEYRESNRVKRNDFMQLLIEMENKGTLDTEEETSDTSKADSLNDAGLTMNEIAAQAFIFFAAGFETSSTTMSFCLYELAMNREVQERVQEEIDAALRKHEDKITYEAIQEMEYLDNVISETLRKYPPAPFLVRECTKKYTIPGTDVVIEKGTLIIIPVMGLHRDQKYYPDPERFDPDRFSKEMKDRTPQFTYLPFGEGPRVCIGMRFGLQHIKVALVSLLSKYSFHVSNRTSVPLKTDTRSIITSAAGGVWLKIKKRFINK